MDYKKEIIEMIEKADHDQLYTIFRFILLSYLPKHWQVSGEFPTLIHLD